MGGPVGKTAEIVAVFPDEPEEFPGVEMGGFVAEECFKAPLEIGTVPRMKAIAAGGYPVVAERLPHGGIVHGKKMREREKMVKKRRNACAEGAEDTKERRKKKEEGRRKRSYRERSCGLGAQFAAPLRGKTVKENPGPRHRLRARGNQTHEKN